MDKEGKTKKTVKVLPYKYQPTKAELEEDLSIPTTPENLAKAVVADVRLQEVKAPR